MGSIVSTNHGFSRKLYAVYLIAYVINVRYRQFTGPILLKNHPDVNMTGTSDEHETIVIRPRSVWEAPKDTIKNTFKKANMIPHSIPNVNDVISKMSNWKFFMRIQKLRPKLVLLMAPVDLIVNVVSAVTIMKDVQPIDIGR